MRVCCCGVVHSTTDYNTWWCFDRYRLKKNPQDCPDGLKIKYEIIYVLSCIKNNCTKLIIQSFGGKTKIKKLDEKELHGKAATNSLKEYQNKLSKMPLSPPYKRIYSSKKIPAVYGKVIDFETQKRQYLDESGSPDNKILKAPYIRRFEG